MCILAGHSSQTLSWSANMPSVWSLVRISETSSLASTLAASRASTHSSPLTTSAASLGWWANLNLESGLFYVKGICNIWPQGGDATTTTTYQWKGVKRRDKFFASFKILTLFSEVQVQSSTCICTIYFSYVPAKKSTQLLWPHSTGVAFHLFSQSHSTLLSVRNGTFDIWRFKRLFAFSLVAINIH